MDNMKILIKFPTRGRPKQFISTLNKYIKYADAELEFVITLDSDDITMNNFDMIQLLDTYDNLTYSFGKSNSKIHAVNKDMEDREFDILLLASDDMVPVKKGYDTIIKKAMTKLYPDTDGILWFNEGYLGMQNNTLSIMGKKYYDRFNYIYHPDYKSLWCDNEFMEVGNLLGKQTYIDLVIIEHRHVHYVGGKEDAIHKLNTEHHPIDKSTFHKRKIKGFPIESVL
jgi:hypothetical protein